MPLAIAYIFLFLLPLRNVVEKIPNLFGISGLGSVHIIFIVAILATVLAKKDEDEQSVTPPMIWLIAAYLAYLLFEVMLTDPNITSFDERITAWKDHCLLLAVYFIVFWSIRTRREMLLALIIMGLANLYMDVYFWRWVRWTSFDNYADAMKIVNGTFGSVGGSNEWAAFFSTYTPMMIAILPALRGKVAQILVGALAAANIVVLLYTFSRGAYVAFAAALLWYFMVKRKYGWLLVLFVGVFAYSFVLPQVVVERIQMTGQVSEYGEVTDQDVQSRLQMWEISLDMFKNSPLIGHGLFSFQFEHWNNPHNYHLGVLAEMGIIGYGLFLLLLIVPYRLAGRVRAWAEDDFAREFALGVQLSIVALVVCNLFGNRWSYLPLAGYYWVVNAFCHRLLAELRQPDLADGEE